MKEKKDIIYLIIIIALVAIIGVLWLLIINTNTNGSNANNMGGPIMNKSSQPSYSALKEITTDENITSGEF